MKAAVVHDFTPAAEHRERPQALASDGRVLVRIEAGGLRHTDIHAARGEWPI
jgi:alcohol dehydrogenase, propanol-preferring